MKPAAGKPTLVPKLRFPEFRGGEGWEDVPINNHLEVREERQTPNVHAPLYSLTIEDGITVKSERYNREFLVRDAGNKKYKLVRPKDIVYNPSNLRWGAINYSRLDHSVVVSPIYEVLYVKDLAKTCQEFIACAVMRDRQIKRFVTKGQGTLVERIAVKIDDFVSTSLPMPSNREEQRRIALCLSSLDDLIVVERHKLDALMAHKKGLMQQLFPREGETRPRLRFPEFQNAPNWEKKELHAVADPVTERAENNTANNILTLSADQGLILQSEYFGKKIAGVNAERYFMIHKDDFVYNDRTTKSSAYGTIKRLKKHPHGIVSPIYKCFRFIAEEAPDYWEQYFEAGAHDAQLKTLANEGARAGRFNVSIDRFLATTALVPLINEERRIADFLSALDDIVAAQSYKVEVLKTQKNGLLQQLFPAQESDP